jgi:TRAP-type C4-dicarboxylate transport system permease small subunit
VFSGFFIWESVQRNATKAAWIKLSFMKGENDMLKKILNTVDKSLTLFEEWSIFLMVMTGLLALFANVVLRYGFNYTLAWSEEYIKLVLIYTTFIGLSVSVKNKSMVKVDVLIQFFPKTRFPLIVFSNLATIVFSVLMLVYGWKMAIQQASTGQTTIIMQIPMIFLYALIPLMGGLTLIRTLQVLYQDIVSEKAKNTNT